MTKIPRPRFTLRRLMVAVAIVGGLLGLKAWMDRKSEDFRQRAEIHSLNWASFHHIEDSPRLQRQYKHYRDMMDKYERAARHPWLPVEPDPPVPE